MKEATIMIFNTLSKCMRLFLFLAIYLFMFTKKNPKKIIKTLYLWPRQVLHNQLLLNPPGRERSKGKWS